MIGECTLSKRKPRRVSFLAFFLICVLLVFFYFKAVERMDQQLDTMKQEAAQYQQLLDKVKAEKKEVELEIAQAGTDAYIENIARTEYGFLKPGEIRFEITNPEVLFGDTVPSSSQP